MGVLCTMTIGWVALCAELIDAKEMRRNCPLAKYVFQLSLKSRFFVAIDLMGLTMRGLVRWRRFCLNYSFDCRSLENEVEGRESYVDCVVLRIFVILMNVSMVYVASDRRSFFAVIGARDLLCRVASFERSLLLRNIAQFQRRRAQRPKMFWTRSACQLEYEKNDSPSGQHPKNLFLHLLTFGPLKRRDTKVDSPAIAKRKSFKGVDFFSYMRTRARNTKNSFALLVVGGFIEFRFLVVI